MGGRRARSATTRSSMAPLAYLGCCCAGLDCQDAGCQGIVSGVRIGGGMLLECAAFSTFRRAKSMHRVLVLGAGKIGALISGLLAESGSYRVNLGDVDGAAAQAVAR